MVRVTTPRALEFACQSAACAPPPVGTGGSGGSPRTPAQVAWDRKLEMLIPVKGSLKVKSGVAHLDGKPITGRIVKSHSGVWSARVRNAEKSLVFSTTQTEVSRQAARIIEGSVPTS